MCVLVLYVYTLVINSEMSVKVSAFVGKLIIAHIKKHFHFRKHCPQRQKSHHLYWNPDYESTHVCIYRRRNFKKKKIKYVYQYETFFLSRNYFTDLQMK